MRSEPLVFGAAVLWHLLRHGRRYDAVHLASFPYFSLLAAALLRPLHGGVLLSSLLRNKDIGRRAKQLIEVRKGGNNDIQHAIVREMIAIIRAEVQGDFTWTSERLGQRITMSARPADNAALEAFLVQEFFSGPTRSAEPRGRRP